MGLTSNLGTKEKWKITFCVNYRQLNKVTKKDNYPLPRIDEILDSIGKAQWFTSLERINQKQLSLQEMELMNLMLCPLVYVMLQELFKDVWILP